MSFSSNYNFLDRSLHYIAFSVPIVQKTLCDLENDLFRREFTTVDSSDEVFVTGLPRAGTTLMLELLYATGEFSTYTYRHMPFILAPLLWNKLSQSFRKDGSKQERAHGDGMQVSVDSPEAFEEVVWLTYMADEIVQRNTLATVSANQIKAEFREILINSVRKIIAISEQAESCNQRKRYLSKNNANISRIDALKNLFPTSKILVLFRHPLAHISSLARQHERFLQEHESDNFSRRYMKWIGHFDFGENFKPINFGDWLNPVEVSSPIDATFWLRYWNAAYSYALGHKADNVCFVDFDQLLKDGSISLRKISRLLALNQTDCLVDAEKVLRSPTTRPFEHDDFPPNVLDRAQNIHAQLKSLAI